MTPYLTRLGMIVACLLPTLTCFGLAGALLLNGHEKGWGWFLLVGVICAEVPGRLFRLPEECPICHARRTRAKPDSAYFEAAEV